MRCRWLGIVKRGGLWAKFLPMRTTMYPCSRAACSRHRLMGGLLFLAAVLCGQANASVLTKSERADAHVCNLEEEYAKLKAISSNINVSYPSRQDTMTMIHQVLATIVPQVVNPGVLSQSENRSKEVLAEATEFSSAIVRFLKEALVDSHFCTTSFNATGLVVNDKLFETDLYNVDSCSYGAFHAAVSLGEDFAQNERTCKVESHDYVAYDVRSKYKDFIAPGNMYYLNEKWIMMFFIQNTLVPAIEYFSLLFETGDFPSLRLAVSRWSGRFPESMVREEMEDMPKAWLFAGTRSNETTCTKDGEVGPHTQRLDAMASLTVLHSIVKEVLPSWTSCSKENATISASVFYSQDSIVAAVSVLQIFQAILVPDGVRGENRPSDADIIYTLQRLREALDSSRSQFGVCVYGDTDLHTMVSRLITAGTGVVGCVVNNSSGLGTCLEDPGYIPNCDSIPLPGSTYAPSVTNDDGSTAAGPDTVPSPEAAEENSPACFPSSATVQLENGEVKDMTALRVGDSVRVSATSFSKVTIFTHSDASHSSVMRRITIESVGGVRHELTTSPEHLVYANKRLVTAESVAVGDEMGLVEASSSRPVLGRVVANSRVSADGLYNPQTVDGDIVVDGVLCSTFTTEVDPWLARAMLLPLNVASRLFNVHVAFLSRVLQFGEPPALKAIRTRVLGLAAASQSLAGVSCPSS